MEAFAVIERGGCLGWPDASENRTENQDEVGRSNRDPRAYRRGLLRRGRPTHGGRDNNIDNDFNDFNDGCTNTDSGTGRPSRRDRRPR